MGGRGNSGREGYVNSTEKRGGSGRNGWGGGITKQRLTFYNRERNQGRNRGGSRPSTEVFVFEFLQLSITNN